MTTDRSVRPTTCRSEELRRRRRLRVKRSAWRTICIWGRSQGCLRYNRRQPDQRLAGSSTPFTATSDVTQILSAIDNGDPSAAEKLLPLVYEELRRLAAIRLATEKPGQTLQVTALMNHGNYSNTRTSFAWPHGASAISAFNLRSFR